MTSLAEALEGAGFVEQVAPPPSVLLKSKPKTDKIFRLSVTKEEIIVSLTIRCARWQDGLEVIRQHKLNSADNKENLTLKLQNWYVEPIPDGDGAFLKYWILDDKRE
jgi:hypothetical protein